MFYLHCVSQIFRTWLRATRSKTQWEENSSHLIRRQKGEKPVKSFQLLKRVPSEMQSRFARTVLDNWQCISKKQWFGRMWNKDRILRNRDIGTLRSHLAQHQLVLKAACWQHLCTWIIVGHRLIGKSFISIADRTKCWRPSVADFEVLFN